MYNPRKANLVAENTTSFPEWLSSPHVEPIKMILAFVERRKFSSKD